MWKRPTAEGDSQHPSRILEHRTEIILTEENRMKSDMERVPAGYIGLEIYGAYVKGNVLVVIGEPYKNDSDSGEDSKHNCDAMGCGTMDHVLVSCEIPEWQAAQFKGSA